MPKVQEMQGLALLQRSKDRGGRIKATLAGMIKVIKECKQRLDAAIGTTQEDAPKNSHMICKMQLMASAAEQISVKQEGHA